MKKKIVLALLIGCMALSISACDKGSKDSTQTGTEVSQEKVYLTADDYKWEDFITLGDYTGFKIDVAEQTVSDEDVEQALQNLKSSYTEYKEVEDTNTTVSDGSTVNITYTCKCDGEEVASEAATGIDYVLGDYEYVEGLDASLLGKKKGDTFDLEVQTDESFYNTDLAGKKLVYTVTVNYVAHAVEPELTDAWFAENTEYQTKDEWVAATRTSLEAQAQDSMESSFRQSLAEKIVEKSTFKEFPKELLDSQLEYYKAGDESTAQSYGTDLEDFIETYYGYASMEDYEADLKDYIDNSLKVNFALKALEASEKVEVSDEDLAAFTKQCMELYGFNTEEELKEYYGEDTLKKACENDKVWAAITAKNEMNIVQESQEVEQ